MTRIWLYVFVLMTIAACNKEAQYIETIRSGENPYLLQMDTLSGDFTLFRDDSILTSTNDYALIGYTRHSETGITNAGHYLQYNKPETLPDMDRTARFDSLILIIHSDSLYYGDTSSALQLSVHRLQENIRSETSLFYNTSYFGYDPSASGSYNGVFRPTSGDSIRIRLNEPFGKELFELIQMKSTIVTGQDRFENWFKGFFIHANGQSTNVLYKLKKNIVMRLYYSEDDATRKSKSIDLAPSSSPYQYNYFSQDFSGTPFEQLNRNKEMPIPASQASFLLQSFSNIRCYVRFSGIRDIKKISSFVQLLNAQLEIKPQAGSYTSATLPGQVHLYIKDVNNAITGPLVGSDNAAQTGNLLIDTDFGKNTRYVYDVTSYVQYELESTNITSQRLVIQIGGTENILKSLLAYTSSGSNSNRARLILSMLVYQQTN